MSPVRATRSRSWLVDQLPVGMLDDRFFHDFVRLFQAGADTILEQVDNIDNIVDLTVAPIEMLRWLAGWTGMTALELAPPSALSEEEHRRALRAWGASLGRRSTPLGLASFLEAVTGGPVEVEDPGGILVAEGVRTTTDPGLPGRGVPATGTPLAEWQAAHGTAGNERGGPGVAGGGAAVALAAGAGAGAPTGGAGPAVGAEAAVPAGAPTGGAGEAPAAGLIRIRLASAGWLSEAGLITLIREQIPAHLHFEVQVAGRRVWPAGDDRRRPSGSARMPMARAAEPDEGPHDPAGRDDEGPLP